MARCSLTQPDNGRTMSIRVNDQIVIALGENASTGFLWEVFEYDPSILTVADSPSSAGPPNGVGSGGVHAFMFTAVAPGTSPIGIKLWRGFEPDDQVQKYRLTVQVDPIP